MVMPVGMTQPTDALVRAIELQALGCERFGSQFSARLARAVSANIAASGAFAAFARPWTDMSVPQLFDEAVPLRFLGALHHLVLTGAAPDLAAEYPSMTDAPDWDALARAASAAVRAHQDDVAEFLKSPPQTNEVNRSACLVGGFLTVAKETRLPLRCLEIGASAGLNLNWDRFRYDFGAAGAWGDADSAVRLGTEWTGDPPPFDQAVRVLERRGCDQRPIDVSDPVQALRLEAYVWPDQTERLARLRGAIGLAREHPPRLEAVDAGAWASVHAHPRAGVATVLYHSVVWQYLGTKTRETLVGAIQAAGESAAADRPFAWLRMEPVPNDMTAPMDLRLTLWPDGRETLLARVHPHGARVDWIV